MDRSLPLKGLAVGAAATMILAAVSAALAMALERTIDLGALGSARYASSADGAFALDAEVGWLGLALPLIGMIAGFAAFRRPRRTRQS